MKNDLFSSLWDEVLACEDINNAYSKFIHLFKNAYENNCISKRRMNNKYHVRKPWKTILYWNVYIKQIECTKDFVKTEINQQKKYLKLIAIN